MDYITNAPKGAALLDEERPGWYLDIDTESLSMGSFQSCIIGQLYGLSALDMWEAAHKYDKVLYTLDANPVEYGFERDYDNDEPLTVDSLPAWEHLGEEWKALIQERLAADPISAPLV